MNLNRPRGITDDMVERAAPFHCLERFTTDKVCNTICDYCRRSARDALEAAGAPLPPPPAG